MRVLNTILECYTEPTGNFGYKARDGYYYNGYMLSSDCADDSFGEAVRKTADELAKDLGLSATGLEPGKEE